MLSGSMICRPSHLADGVQRPRNISRIPATTDVVAGLGGHVRHALAILLDDLAASTREVLSAVVWSDNNAARQSLRVVGVGQTTNR